MNITKCKIEHGIIVLYITDMSNTTPICVIHFGGKTFHICNILNTFIQWFVNQWYINRTINMKYWKMVNDNFIKDPCYDTCVFCIIVMKYVNISVADLSVTRVGLMMAGKKNGKTWYLQNYGTLCLAGLYHNLLTKKHFFIGFNLGETSQNMMIKLCDISIRWFVNDSNNDILLLCKLISIYLYK